MSILLALLYVTVCAMGIAFTKLVIIHGAPLAM